MKLEIIQPPKFDNQQPNVLCGSPDRTDLSEALKPKKKNRRPM